MGLSLDRCALMLPLRRLLFARRLRFGEDAARFHVRAMRPQDLDEVMRIERASFPDAWTAEVLESWLRRAHASCHVLERGGESVGFFLLEYGRDHLHLANLAVAPEVRRQGIGTLALQAIENIAWVHGLPRVVLEVRETNLAAQLLYRRSGYRAVEIVRSYYRDQDAYRMTKVVSRWAPLELRELQVSG